MDVSHQLATLASRPLLLWHGDEETWVPPGETFRLQHALQQSGLAENLTASGSRACAHRITPEALAETVGFFKRTL
ncbi:esterase [Raoultella terrigena]|uniref:Esterase n=1 Tax=Raoultella terrigena TaxID=577 RepID=A0A4U9DBU1_RAOTE|nr:esterase [Raoultella terrigena]